MKIRKYCSRCRIQIDYHKESFYFQIQQRENRENRDTAFLCTDCCKDLVSFMEIKMKEIKNG